MAPGSFLHTAQKVLALGKLPNWLTSLDAPEKLVTAYLYTDGCFAYVRPADALMCQKVCIFSQCYQLT